MLTNTLRPPGRRSPPRSSHSEKSDKDLTIVVGVLCSMEFAGWREGVSRQLVQHSQQPSVSGRARRVDPKNVVKTTLVLVRGLLSYAPPGLCRFCVCLAPDMEFGVED